MDDKLNSFERYKRAAGLTALSAAGGVKENEKGGNAPRRGRFGEDSDIEAAPRQDKKLVEQQPQKQTEVSTAVPIVSQLEQFVERLQNDPKELDRLVTLHQENAMRAFERTNAKRQAQADLTKPENVRRLNDRFKRAEKLSSLFLFDSQSWHKYSKEDGDYTIRIQTQEIYKELQEAIAELAEHMPSAGVGEEWKRDATRYLEEWYQGKLEWDSAAVVLRLFSDPDEGKRRRELYRISFDDNEDDTLYAEDSHTVRANALVTLYNYSRLVTQPMRRFVRVMDLARPLIGADLLTPEQLTKLTGEEHILQPESTPEAYRNQEIKSAVGRLLSPFGIMDSYELPLGLSYSTLNAKERIEVAAEITADLAVRNAYLTTRSEENVDLISSFLENASREMDAREQTTSPMSQGRFGDFAEDRDERVRAAQQLKEDIDDDRYIMIRQSMLEALSRDSKSGNDKCERPNFCSGVLNGFYREMLDRDENSLGHRTRKDLRRKCNEKIEEITRNEVRNNPQFTQEGKDTRVYIGEVNFMSQELRRMTDQNIDAALETVNETAEQYKKRIPKDNKALLEAEDNTRAVTIRALEKLRRVAEREGDALDAKSDPEIRASLVESFEVAAEARRTVLAMAVGESSSSSSSSAEDKDGDVVMGDARNNESFLNQPTRRVSILFKRKRNGDDNTELNAEEKNDRESVRNGKKRRIDPNASSKSSLHQDENDVFIPSMAKSKGRMKNNERVAVKVADPVAVKKRTRKSVTKTVARVTKVVQVVEPDTQPVQERRAAIETKRKSSIKEKLKTEKAKSKGKGKGKEKEKPSETQAATEEDKMDVDGEEQDDEDADVEVEVTDREALVSANDWVLDGILASAVIAVATVSAVYVGYNSPWAATTSAMNSLSSVDTSIINAQSGIDQAFKAFDTTANELKTMATILDKIIKDETFDKNNREELKLIKQAKEEATKAHERYESLTEGAQMSIKRLHVAHLAQSQFKEIVRTFNDLLQGDKTPEEIKNIKLDYAIALEYFKENLAIAQEFCTKQTQSYAQSLLAVTLLEQAKAIAEPSPDARPQLSPGNASIGTFSNSTFGQQVTELYQQDLVTHAVTASSILSSVPKLFELKNHQAPIYDASQKPQVSQSISPNQNTGEATLVYNMRWNKEGDQVVFPIRSVNIPEECAPSVAAQIALDNTQNVFDYITSSIDLKIAVLKLDGITAAYSVIEKIANGQFEKDLDKTFADSFAKIERDLNDNRLAFEASRKGVTALKTLVEKTKNTAARRVCTRHIQEMDKNYKESEDACDVLKTHLSKVYREISQRAILEESTHVVELLYGNVPNWGKIVNPHQEAVKNNASATPGSQMLQGANVTARHQENAASVSNAFANSWMGDFFDAVHRGTSFLFGDVGRVFRRFRVLSVASSNVPSRDVLNELLAWSEDPKGFAPEFIQNCSNYYVDPDDLVHDRLSGAITLDKLPRLRTRPLAEALKIDRNFDMPSKEQFDAGLTEKQGQTLFEGIVKRSTCDAALNIVRNAAVKKGDVDYETSRVLKEDSQYVFERIQEASSFASWSLDAGTTVLNTYINVVTFLRALSNAIDLVAGVSEMVGSMAIDESDKEEAEYREEQTKARAKRPAKRAPNPKKNSYREPLVLSGVNLNGDCESETIRSKIAGRSAKSSSSKLIWLLAKVKRFLAAVIKVVELPLEYGPKIYRKFKEKIARLSGTFKALEKDDPDAVWYAKAGRRALELGAFLGKGLAKLGSLIQASTGVVKFAAKVLIVLAAGIGAGYLTYRAMGPAAVEATANVVTQATANVTQTVIDNTPSVVAESSGAWGWISQAADMAYNAGAATVNAMKAGADAVADLAIEVKDSTLSTWNNMLRLGATIFIGGSVTVAMGVLAYFADKLFWTIVGAAGAGLAFWAISGSWMMVAATLRIAGRVAWNYVISKVAPLMIRCVLVYVLDRMLAKAKEEETSGLLSSKAKQREQIIRLLLIVALQYGLSTLWSTLQQTVFTPETLGGGNTRQTLSDFYSSFSGHFWAGVNGTQTSLIVNATASTIPYAQTLTEDNWRVLKGTFSPDDDAAIAQRYSNALTSISTIFNLMMNRK